MPDFLGYQVSSHGRVLGKYGRVLKSQVNSDGYLRLTVHRGGKQHSRFVHQLVLTAFVGPCPDELECCHWDDVKAHNCVGNLRWDTQSANQFDAARNGLNVNANKTHCPVGHAYADAYVSPDNRRNCRVCNREAVARYRANKRLH